MPVTGLDFPILQHFFCIVESRTGIPVQPLDAMPESQQAETTPKPLPKGIVLGPDGKPCRSCTSFASWKALSKQKPESSEQQTPSSSISGATSAALGAFGASTADAPPSDCPPDVEQLGRSTWTLLHTMTANYPERPTITQQLETRQFLGLFGKMYPCWVCADDFRAWMASGNEPRVSNRQEFGRWMCEAHNAVNEKLGKTRFDCERWEERWRTGWKDGRCD